MIQINKNLKTRRMFNYIFNYRLFQNKSEDCRKVWHQRLLKAKRHKISETIEELNLLFLILIRNICFQEFLQEMGDDLNPQISESDAAKCLHSTLLRNRFSMRCLRQQIHKR